MQTKTIRVFYSQHRATGLWKAESPDLRGLLIFDDSRKALEDDLPEAVKILLEAEGHSVVDVVWVDEVDGWAPPLQGAVAEARLAA